MSDESERQRLSDFLAWLLPDEGWKALCLKGARGIDQIFSESVDELAGVALAASARGVDVYHACAVFADPGPNEWVANPRKPGSRIKAWNLDRRTKARALGACALWLDLDAGEGKPYADGPAAYRALGNVVEQHGLPLPTVVSSGGGLHAYWPLDRVLRPDLWTPLAVALKSFCARVGLHADETRTADVASILRPPGTRNHKYDPARDVSVAVLVDAVDPQALLQKFLTAGRAPANDTVSTAVLGGLPTGTAQPPDMTIGFGDGQRTAELVKRAGWCLGPWDLDVEAAVVKCLGWNAFNTPPLDEAKVRSTVESIARREAERRRAAENTVSIVPTEDLPPVPKPYVITAAKQLGRWVKGEEATGPTIEVVYKAPILVTGFRRGETIEGRTLAVRHWLPHDGWADCVIPWRDQSPRAVIGALGAQGVNLHPWQHKWIMDYLHRGIDMLQDERATDLEYEQFGWKGNSFLLGHELFDGGISCPVGIGVEARQRADMMKPVGDYAGWATAANKLFAPGHEAQAFGLLCSFAAPLMRFRLEAGGTIVSMVGHATGAGKTTALIAAASVWGAQHALDINRTDTQNSRFRSIALLSNLPVVFDELRNRDPEVVKDFVLTFTDGRDKNRLNMDGSLRRLSTGWSTVLITAANVSLAEAVSFDGEIAQAARILEYPIEMPAGVIAAEGRTLEKALVANRANAGRRFIQQLATREALEYVRRETDLLDAAYGKAIGSGTEQRFYSALLACVHVAANLLRRWGMLEFDEKRILRFGLEAACGMKKTISARSFDAVAMLSRFINSSWRHALSVAQEVKPNEDAHPLHMPVSGELHMRFERKEGLLLIDRARIRTWCFENKIIFRDFERDLARRGILLNNSVRRSLGLGTIFRAGGQVECWVVDTTHTALSGEPMLERTSNVVRIA